eukprot:3009378-Pleurochrysis_carterae.AAC.1
MVVQVGNLYGHPTAGRHWYKKATNELLEYGFTQSEYDHCFFYMIEDTDMLIVLLYVDDIITAHTRGTS